MKYVSIDLETTGTDPEDNQILEFGAVIEDTENPLPIEELPKFQTYIDNGDRLVGSAYALQMNQQILYRIAVKDPNYTYIEPEELAEAFYGFLQDNGFDADDDGVITINAAGKNFGTFDLNFLKNVPYLLTEGHFSEGCVNILPQVLDPAILYVDWENDRSLPSSKKCKVRAGIDGEVAHEAVADAIDIIKELRPFYT